MGYWRNLLTVGVTTSVFFCGWGGDPLVEANPPPVTVVFNAPSDPPPPVVPGPPKPPSVGSILRAFKKGTPEDKQRATGDVVDLPVASLDARVARALVGATGDSDKNVQASADWAVARMMEKISELSPASATVFAGHWRSRLHEKDPARLEEAITQLKWFALYQSDAAATARESVIPLLQHPDAKIRMTASEAFPLNRNSFGALPALMSAAASAPTAHERWWHESRVSSIVSNTSGHWLPSLRDRSVRPGRSPQLRMVAEYWLEQLLEGRYVSDADHPNHVGFSIEKQLRELRLELSDFRPGLW